MKKFICVFDKWLEIKDGKRVDSEGPCFPGDYEVVAEVVADCLDTAFRLTNSIDTPWIDNKEVITIKKNLRSTSVGDVIIATSGKPFIVASCGFEELN